MSLLVNAYSTLVNPPAINFSCQLVKHRTLDDRLLSSHLAVLVERILKAGNGEMSVNRQALCQYITRVKHHFIFKIEEAQLNNLAKWGWQACAISYLPDGSIRNPNGRVLQTADGKIEQDARIPYPADALQRKDKTEDYLKSIEVEVPTFLPPVLGEGEVVLRSAEEVAKRTLALMIVAVQAEAFRHKQPNNPSDFITRCPIGFAALTSQEYDFIHSESVDQQAMVNMFWRYESVMLLQWTLGWQKDLIISGNVADLLGLVTTGIGFCRDVKNVSLRPAVSLLNALDLYYRLHWLSRQQGVTNAMLANEVNQNVIQERHYALNWLTHSAKTDWD